MPKQSDLWSVTGRVFLTKLFLFTVAIVTPVSRNVYTILTLIITVIMHILSQE